MIHYMVIQPKWVDEQLAQLWLAASDRSAVTAASHVIYHELSADAETKGEEVEQSLRKFVCGPLWVYYTAHPDDCIVKIWSILPAKRQGSDS